nr:hypothetical protein CFP56_50088 [Quercus suber]
MTPAPEQHPSPSPSWASSPMPPSSSASLARFRRGTSVVDTTSSGGTQTQHVVSFGSIRYPPGKTLSCLKPRTLEEQSNTNALGFLFGCS